MIVYPNVMSIMEALSKFWDNDKRLSYFDTWEDLVDSVDSEGRAAKPVAWGNNSLEQHPNVKLTDFILQSSEKSTNKCVENN